MNRTGQEKNASFSRMPVRKHWRKGVALHKAAGIYPLLVPKAVMSRKYLGVVDVSPGVDKNPESKGTSTFWNGIISTYIAFIEMCQDILNTDQMKSVDINWAVLLESMLVGDFQQEQDLVREDEDDLFEAPLPAQTPNLLTQDVPAFDSNDKSQDDFDSVPDEIESIFERPLVQPQQQQQQGQQETLVYTNAPQQEPPRTPSTSNAQRQHASLSTPSITSRTPFGIPLSSQQGNVLSVLTNLDRIIDQTIEDEERERHAAQIVSDIENLSEQEFKRMLLIKETRNKNNRPIGIPAPNSFEKSSSLLIKEFEDYIAYVYVVFNNALTKEKLEEEFSKLVSGKQDEQQRPEERRYRGKKKAPVSKEEHERTYRDIFCPSSKTSTGDKDKKRSEMAGLCNFYLQSMLKCSVMNQEFKDSPELVESAKCNNTQCGPEDIFSLSNLMLGLNFLHKTDKFGTFFQVLGRIERLSVVENCMNNKVPSETVNLWGDWYEVHPSCFSFASVNDYVFPWIPKHVIEFLNYAGMSVLQDEGLDETSRSVDILKYCNKSIVDPLKGKTVIRIVPPLFLFKNYTSEKLASKGTSCFGKDERVKLLDILEYILFNVRLAVYLPHEFLDVINFGEERRMDYKGGVMLEGVITSFESPKKDKKGSSELEPVSTLMSYLNAVFCKTHTFAPNMVTPATYLAVTFMDSFNIAQTLKSNVIFLGGPSAGKSYMIDIVCLHMWITSQKALTSSQASRQANNYGDFGDSVQTMLFDEVPEIFVSSERQVSQSEKQNMNEIKSILSSGMVKRNVINKTRDTSVAETKTIDYEVTKQWRYIGATNKVNRNAEAGLQSRRNIYQIAKGQPIDSIQNVVSSQITKSKIAPEVAILRDAVRSLYYPSVMAVIMMATNVIPFPDTGLASVIAMNLLNSIEHISTTAFDTRKFLNMMKDSQYLAVLHVIIENYFVPNGRYFEQKQFFMSQILDISDSFVCRIEHIVQMFSMMGNLLIDVTTKEVTSSLIRKYTFFKQDTISDIQKITASINGRKMSRMGELSWKSDMLPCIQSLHRRKPLASTLAAPPPPSSSSSPPQPLLYEEEEEEECPFDPVPMNSNSKKRKQNDSDAPKKKARTKRHQQASNKRSTRTRVHSVEEEEDDDDSLDRASDKEEEGDHDVARITEGIFASSQHKKLEFTDDEWHSIQKFVHIAYEALDNCICNVIKHNEQWGFHFERREYEEVDLLSSAQDPQPQPLYPTRREAVLSLAREEATDKESVMSFARPIVSQQAKRSNNSGGDSVAPDEELLSPKQRQTMAEEFEQLLKNVKPPAQAPGSKYYYKGNNNNKASIYVNLNKICKKNEAPQSYDALLDKLRQSISNEYAESEMNRVVANLKRTSKVPCYFSLIKSDSYADLLKNYYGNKTVERDIRVAKLKETIDIEFGRSESFLHFSHSSAGAHSFKSQQGNLYITWPFVLSHADYDFEKEIKTLLQYKGLRRRRIAVPRCCLNTTVESMERFNKTNYEPLFMNLEPNPSKQYFEVKNPAYMCDERRTAIRCMKLMNVVSNTRTAMLAGKTRSNYTAQELNKIMQDISLGNNLHQYATEFLGDEKLEGLINSDKIRIEQDLDEYAHKERLLEMQLADANKKITI